MKHYYEKPTQVKFRDPNYELMNEETEEDRPWIAGIADGEYVICGCCGALIELADLFEVAEGDEYGAEVIEYRAIQAKSFSEAVGVLENYYGKDLISFEAGRAGYEPILLTEENFKE